MFFEKLLRALHEDKIEYAIAGGFAVALHGAVRGTVDVDIVLRLTRGDFERLEASLAKLNLHPRLPVKAKEVFLYRKEYIETRNLIAWSFANPDRPTEIVDVLIPYDLREMRVEKIRYKDLRIPVLSIEDLIKTKEETGRKQDEEDVKALKLIRGRR